MKKILLLVWVLTISILSGCATAPIPIQPVLNTKIVEPSNEEKVSGIGDTLIEEGQYLVYDALDLKEDVSAGGGWQQKFYMPSQLLLAESEDEKFTYYFGNDATMHDSLMGTKYITAGIKILKYPISGKDTVQIFGISPQTTFVKKEEPVIEKTKAIKKSDVGYNKKLIYGGKRNNYLIFKYVQSDNAGSGNDLQFDLEYDPKEGEVFSIKGASIRIISYTSTNIKYIVLSGFGEKKI